MSVPTNRDEARERLRKASLGHDIREVYPTIMDGWNVSAMQADLRAILSGPPEPSEEEVGETIGYYFGTLVSRNPQPDMSGDPRAKLQPHIRRQFDSAAREAAQAVLSLFRNRING